MAGREGETDEERHVRLTGNGWIGVDLDATLAEYHGWRADGAIGVPIPAMVERVKNWLSQGIEVRIFTARVSIIGGENEALRDVAGQREKIELWCFEHIGQRLTVTNIKDYKMIELWDDRAIQVVKNKGTRIGA